MSATVMFNKNLFVAVLSLLCVLFRISCGDIRESYNGHQKEIFSRQSPSQNGKSQDLLVDLVHRRQNGIKIMAAVGDRHGKLAAGYNARYVGHDGKGHNIHSDRRMNQRQGRHHGLKNNKSIFHQKLMLRHPPTLDKKLRIRRANSPKRPVQVIPGGIRLPQGITYTWTRDVGTGKTFNEAAFKSKDKNVVVVLSFDDALRDANLTASATLYDFTGATGVMAIKPRTRPGPCFLVDTSLTYDKILSDLDARNGSSVSTSSVTSLDGTGNPVSLAERRAMLKKTPSLSRQCRGREIIRTTRTGSISPTPYDGLTKELRLLTMHAELSILVPVDLDLGVGPFGLWFEGGAKGSGRAKGQVTWKGH